ncbi:MAG TPA: hypothetical protein VFI15_07655 [Candidatus Limnocylindrales bacterium]|nr:hypothetical protein [Candidatus Limnocylindrales bacterium]
MPERDDDLQPAGGQDEAALAIVARHALHDEELVAALAAGALDGDDEADERSRAKALVDRCPACRAVHDDVAAIGDALHGAATFTAKAPRDFRLSVEDAHRLGGTVITRGPVSALGRALAGFARPIGASVAAIGLVGVLVGSAFVGAAGTPQRNTVDTGSTTAGAASSAAAAEASSSLEIAAGPTTSPKASDQRFTAPTPAPTLEAAPTAWLLIVSVLAIVLGLGLFAYGTIAGRRRERRTETR